MIAAGIIPCNSLQQQAANNTNNQLALTFLSSPCEKRQINVDASSLKRLLQYTSWTCAVLFAATDDGRMIYIDPQINLISFYVLKYRRSIHFWVKDQGSAMIISGDRYEVQEITKSMFEVKMVLIIRKFRKSDVGSYHCIAKNSLGDVDSVVKLHEFKVDGGDQVDRTGAPNNDAFDEDDDLDPLSSYEMGERDMDTTSISRNNNRNRQNTYASNRNNVVVAGAGGGGRGGGTGNSGGHGSNMGGGNGHHNNPSNSNNNNRGKHSNYTPGGERERNSSNNGGGGGGGGGGRGGKGNNNEYRTRHTKRPYYAGGGGKHLDNQMGPGNNNNVYQTQMVPDGSSSPTSSAASSIYSYYHSTKSTNNNHHNSNRNYNNNKAYSITANNSYYSIGLVSQFKKQFIYYFHKYYHPIPLFISGWGLIIQMLQVAGTRRQWFLFSL